MSFSAFIAQYNVVTTKALTKSVCTLMSVLISRGVLKQNCSKSLGKPQRYTNS